MMTDIEKYKILETEYQMLFEEVNSAYNTIQNKVVIISAVYSFIFSGYIGALSQWTDFRVAGSLIVVESVLLLIAFILLFPALFITKFKNWKSFGNPAETIKKLQLIDKIEEYYSAKATEWSDIIKNNKEINSAINTWLLYVIVMLGLTILIILFHITLIL